MGGQFCSPAERRATLLTHMPAQSHVYYIDVVLHTTILLVHLVTYATFVHTVALGIWRGEHGEIGIHWCSGADCDVAAAGMIGVCMPEHSAGTAGLVGWKAPTRDSEGLLQQNEKPKLSTLLGFYSLCCMRVYIITPYHFCFLP